MADSDGHGRTPSQILASRIAQKLSSAGLIVEEHQNKIQKALASGALRDLDWRVEIERALDGEREGSDAG